MLINANIAIETDVLVPVLEYDRPKEMRKLLDALRVIEPNQIYLYVDRPSILKREILKKYLKQKDCVAR